MSETVETDRPRTELLLERSAPSKRTLFHDTCLTEAFDAAAMAALAETCIGVTSVAASADLAVQGDRPRKLHIVLSGWACRYVLLEQGRRQIPALLLRGDIADLDALESEHLSYGILTLTPCQIATFSLPALRAAIDRTPALGNGILTAAIRENVRAACKAVSLAGQSAREQVAFLLCDLVARQQTPDQAKFEGQYELPLTQSVLADTLGLSAVHVNRVLQSLRADGLIRKSASRLAVLNWAGLVSAGQYEVLAGRGLRALVGRRRFDAGGPELVSSM